MKTAIVFIAFAAMFAGTSSAQVYVNPYIDKNGEAHPGHFRTKPNSTDLDNYSTKGNINPYTGQEGTKTPRYEQPAYTPPPVYQAPKTYGSDCGYTSTGRYVCR